MEYGNLSPYYGATVQLVTAAAAVAANISTRGNALLLTNAGTQLVHFRLRLSGVTTAATVADVPLLPNQRAVVRKQADSGGGTNGHTSISVFSPGGAGSTVHATPCDITAV